MDDREADEILKLCEGLAQAIDTLADADKGLRESLEDATGESIEG